MKGEELFGKEGLAYPKALRKMDKEDLYSTYLCILQPIQEYFYEDLYNGDERPYRTKFNDLILNKGDFLRPIFKMLKKGMFEEGELPYGLAFIINNQLQAGKNAMDNQIAELQKAQLTKEVIAEKVDAMKEEYEKIYEIAQNILDILCKKTVKKLKKMGMKDEYARMLAPSLPEKYVLDGRNFFFMEWGIVEALIGIFQMSLVKGDEKTMVSNLGVDLTNPKVIGDIFNLFLKDADTKVMANVVEQLILERRPYNLNTWGKEKLAVYNAISVFTLQTFESKKIFDNNDRRDIIKNVARRRAIDAKKQRDKARRIVISDVDPEVYPRIAAAWKKFENK